VLFNNKGAFHSLWSKGDIVPIHKSGNTDDLNNYRGICISSCFGNFLHSVFFSSGFSLGSVFAEKIEFS
jgi:hypothetical protein